jgi:hypothetical protein
VPGHSASSAAPAPLGNGYTRTAGSWPGRGGRPARAARGPGVCAVKRGIDVTNRVLACYIEVLQLVGGQSGCVTAILSRRARLPGLMWDFDNSL